MNKMLVLLLIGLFCLPTLFSPTSENILAIDHILNQNNEQIVIRIDTSKKIPSLPSNVEIMSGLPGEYLDVIVDEDILHQLAKKGISYSFHSTLSDETDSSIVETYPTFDEMEQYLQTISSTHSEITRLFSIGKSWEDRDIWCLEISDNPGINEEEPEVLFMGLHHAREWPTISISLSIIEKLINSYDILPDLTEIVNQTRIFIIPCVNPDGYYYDHDLHNGGKWWRKNRHFFPDYNLYGVDLNRNYGGSCNGNPKAMWGSDGIRHHPESAVYCGTEPFSEPEIQHIKDFFLNQSLDASISWHTYGELVMWPWGYSTTDQAPDHEEMRLIGIRIANAITKMDQAGLYVPTQSSGLYPTTGDTTDWFYGYSHYVLGRPHFAYTIEACEEFHPDEYYLEQICHENVEGALILLEEVNRVLETPRRVLPPKVTDISTCENSSLRITWEEQNVEANLEKIAVEQFNDGNLVVDQIPKDTSFWELNGFTISNRRAYSGEYSLHSHTEKNQISAMTSSSPLFVTEGMNLSFWCYYDIEKGYDYAFLEISTNGRTFDKIDSFTGQSNEWIKKTYDLKDYEGKSISIRFRYYTDEYTGEDGFWVDDIYPVNTFESVELISEEITTNSFYLTPPGENITSYFRIRGYNEPYQWCDFGQLYQLSETKSNTIPTIPQIIGTSRGKSNQTYNYTLRSIDQDQDEIYYQIQWGDGTQTTWLGPYDSGENITVNHTWTSDGTFLIKARAKDSSGAISDWNQLQVEMPHMIHHPFLYRIQLIIQWILSLWQ